MQDKIRKLKAIKKLSESGIPGEKEAAKHKLEVLSKKWGVSLESLEEEKLKPKAAHNAQAEAYNNGFRNQNPYALLLFWFWVLV